MQRTLDEVNKLLADWKNPIGAYALGAICARAWSEQRQPHNSEMCAALECETLDDLRELLREG